MQTHLSEQREEIAWVQALFPKARDYLDVYEGFGLLGAGGLYGHAIHLTTRERARLHEVGAALIHCPTSNAFIGSGLFDMAGLKAEGQRVGLATDIGGGTSWSMLATQGRAIEVARLAGARLDATRAFYLATLGNARALGLDAEIGALEPGPDRDMILIDPRATPVLAARDDLSESLEDLLFALAILGDERAVRSTWIAGRLAHEKPTPTETAR